MAGTVSRTRRGAARWAILPALALGALLGAAGVAWWVQEEVGPAPEPNGSGERVRAAEAGREAAELEAREARMAFTALAREAAVLRDRIAGLEARLAATEPVLPEPAAGPADVSLEALAQARVVDASEELGFVALDIGARNGMRPGVLLDVVRDGARIARLRAVDVEEEITGAAVESTEPGAFPETGDRVVLGRSGV